MGFELPIRSTESGGREVDGVVLCCLGFVMLLDVDTAKGEAYLQEARDLFKRLGCSFAGDLDQAITELELKHARLRSTE